MEANRSAEGVVGVIGRLCSDIESAKASTLVLSEDAGHRPIDELDIAFGIYATRRDIEEECDCGDKGCGYE